MNCSNLPFTFGIYDNFGIYDFAFTVYTPNFVQIAS